MDADAIVDRRRLRRKLSFWRVAAFLALIVAIGAGFAVALGPDIALGMRAPHIARISISGFIGNDTDQLKMLERIRENRSVRAVILSVNSTGGSTVGGEALYEGLRKLAEEKPMVATIGTAGASAAYMAAVASDHIVARRSSITGSVGVIFQYPHIEGLLEKLGIEVEEIRSGALKAAPSPFQPLDENARGIIAGVVTSSYDWFLDLVRERRKLNEAETILISDGRIFTGEQARANRLVDAIGGEDEALAWLESEHDIDPETPVKDWTVSRTESFSLARVALLWLAERAGIAPAGFESFGVERFLPETPMLDGLLSVWQAPAGRADGEGASR